MVGFWFMTAPALKPGGSGMERSAGRPGSRRLGGGGRAAVRSERPDLPGRGRTLRRGDGQRAAARGGPLSVAKRCGATATLARNPFATRVERRLRAARIDGLMIVVGWLAKSAASASIAGSLVDLLV